MIPVGTGRGKEMAASGNARAADTSLQPFLFLSSVSVIATGRGDVAGREAELEAADRTIVS
jgi:hypothetical protein